MAKVRSVDIAARAAVIYNIGKKESGLKTKLLYIGRTNNLKRRLQEHLRQKFKRYYKNLNVMICLLRNNKRDNHPETV